MPGKTNNEIITRNFNLEIETREDDNKTRHISGVIPYDSESENLGGFVEVIRKGTFTKTVRESNIRCLWAHNTQYVLGNTAAKTLTFEDRDDGLHFDAVVPNTSWAADVFETIARRDAPGVSFGFTVKKDAWTRGEKGKPDIRELLEVRLYEVSVGVAFPAYPDSDSAASTRDLFSKNGIDIDNLASVLLRAEGGKIKAENEDDVKSLRSAIENLSSLIPETRDEGEPEPEKSTPDDKPSDTDTYEANARQIALMELEGLEY